MWSHKKFLEACSKLKEAGHRPQFNQGDVIARGYADLGYEEFLLITDQKMVSLYSGTTSNLPNGHADHFFLVPTHEQMVEEIGRRGGDIVAMTYRDQRTWNLELLLSGGVSREAQGPTIAEALLQGLTAIVGEKRA